MPVNGSTLMRRISRFDALLRPYTAVTVTVRPKSTAAPGISP